VDNYHAHEKIMTELSDRIEADASKPQSMASDGKSVTNRSLQDQIAADKYLREVEGTAPQNIAATLRGICLKIVPPGVNG
jgi:hypothetical protein